MAEGLLRVPPGSSWGTAPVIPLQYGTRCPGEFGSRPADDWINVSAAGIDIAYDAREPGS